MANPFLLYLVTKIIHAQYLYKMPHEHAKGNNFRQFACFEVIDARDDIVSKHSLAMITCLLSLVPIKV